MECGGLDAAVWMRRFGCSGLDAAVWMRRACRSSGTGKVGGGSAGRGGSIRTAAAALVGRPVVCSCLDNRRPSCTPCA
eukprot:359096-Chlamydomonas_euryale.AAC.2